jgi:hypothetical protein
MANHTRSADTHPGAYRRHGRVRWEQYQRGRGWERSRNNGRDLHCYRDRHLWRNHHNRHSNTDRTVAQTDSTSAASFPDAA